MTMKTYKLIITSPMGKKECTLNMDPVEARFTGTFSFMGQEVEIRNGQTNKEGGFFGEVTLKSPIGRMDCKLIGTILNEQVNGKLKTEMGNMPFVSC